MQRRCETIQYTALAVIAATQLLAAALHQARLFDLSCSSTSSLLLQSCLLSERIASLAPHYGRNKLCDRIAFIELAEDRKCCCRCGVDLAKSSFELTSASGKSQRSTLTLVDVQTAPSALSTPACLPCSSAFAAAERSDHVHVSSNPGF